MADLSSDRLTYKLQALASVMANVTHFNGKNFKMWSENVATAIDSLRPDIVKLMDGEERPTGEGSVTWDRANKDLYAILFKATIKAGGAAAMIVRKYKDETRRSGAGGHGKRAWDALGEKYSFESDEMIRDLMDELRSIKMTTGQDPDEYFLRAEQLRSDLAAHKEPVSDRQYKDIITNGISDEYPDVLFTIRRDPNFSVDDIHRTMSAIYRKDISRNGKPKISGRGTVLAATFDRRTCFNCNQTGHIARNCPERKQQVDSNGQGRSNSPPVGGKKKGGENEKDGAPCTKQRPIATTNAWPRRRKRVKLSLRSAVRKTYPELWRPYRRTELTTSPRG